MEFLDGSTLVSCSDDGSTKFWDIATGMLKTEVPGEKFTFSKAAAGSEQRAGRFLVTSQGDLVLVHLADGGGPSDAKKAPVASFRATLTVRGVHFSSQNCIQADIHSPSPLPHMNLNVSERLIWTKGFCHGLRTVTGLKKQNS